MMMVPTLLGSRKLGFVFPGQGSQSVGMGYELAGRFEDFEKIYSQCLKEADETLGFKLSKLMKEGPADELKMTPITQPALLCLSTALGRWLSSNDIKADISLGHSLGEYSALVHSGSLSYVDALRIVHARGKFMSEALPAGAGGMAALVGASIDDARSICNAITTKDLILELAVINSPGQIVVSGHSKAIELAGEKAQNLGIRKIVKLEVSGPFHCSLLRSAGEKLGELLASIQIKQPAIPVVFNTTAKPEADPQKIIKNLIHQVSQTVLWADCVHYAGDEAGINDFIELGSGKVLTGLIRKILPDARCTPLEGLQKLALIAA